MALFKVKYRMVLCVDRDIEANNRRSAAIAMSRKVDAHEVGYIENLPSDMLVERQQILIAVDPSADPDRDGSEEVSNECNDVLGFIANELEDGVLHDDGTITFKWKGKDCTLHSDILVNDDDSL